MKTLALTSSRQELLFLANSCKMDSGEQMSEEKIPKEGTEHMRRVSSVWILQPCDCARAVERGSLVSI